MSRGGFKAEILGTKKVGQLHFSWNGEVEKLREVFEELTTQLKQNAQHITANMEKRGGGIQEVELVDFTDVEPNYYQLRCNFETCDSMGANFINSCLESFGQTLRQFVASHAIFSANEKEVVIIMAILSNYTPECVVRASVECIDAVVLATGNDFRAIEAGGHTYAAKDGQYRSLSHCSIEDGIFKFWLEVPLALGTVGGLTSLHPVAKRSLELLGNPSAQNLMEIIGVTGLAQNFAAVRSLVTVGIQKGHMKMHLINILNQLEASEKEIKEAVVYFKDKVVSFAAVREFIDLFRAGKDSKQLLVGQ